MPVAKIMFSLPPGLLAEIDQAAGEEQRSRSELLRDAARMYLQGRRLTRKPGDDFGGDVKASYAQDDTYLLSGTVGGPATDTLSWSLTGDYRNTNGFYENKNTGSDFANIIAAQFTGM